MWKFNKTQWLRPLLVENVHIKNGSIHFLEMVHRTKVFCRFPPHKTDFHDITEIYLKVALTPISNRWFT